MYYWFNYSSPSGGGPKCVKGNSCGAACIARGEKCLADFPPKANEGIQQMAQALVKKIGSGTLTEEQADDIVLGLADEKAGLKNLSEFISSGRATPEELEGMAEILVSVYLNPNQDRRASRTPTYEDLVQTDKMLKELEAAEKASETPSGGIDFNAPGGMGDFVRKRKTREFSQEAAEIAYSLLPQKIRLRLNTKGAVKDGVAYDGIDDQGNVIFGNNRKERGVMLLRTFAEQKGICPYTGRKLHLFDAEPEHLYSFSEAAKRGVSGDQPYNLLMADGGINNKKSDFRVAEFRKSVKEQLAMGKEEYDRKVYTPSVEAATRRKGRAASASEDLHRIVDNIPQEERVRKMRELAKAYGAQDKYLIKEALGSDAFVAKTPDSPRTKGRSLKLSANVRIFGKPFNSTILTAYASLSPERRNEFRDRMEQLRQRRATFTPEEIEIARRSPEARLEVQKMNDQEYQASVEKLVSEFSPNISSYI